MPAKAGIQYAEDTLDSRLLAVLWRWAGMTE